MPEKMKWEKASPELGELIAKAVTGMGVEKKIMFGAPVYTVNRNSLPACTRATYFYG
jgi:hypothetical protein